MSLDPNSAKGQMTEVYNSLASYFQSCASHLQGTGSPPSMSPLLSLKVDEALSLSVLTTEKGSSERVGALVESVAMATAILRETDMATQTRGQIYAAAASDYSSDSDLMANLSSAELGLFGSK